MKNQGTLFDDKQADTLYYERNAYLKGFRAVAGIDEAGRGPLAGPVTAAAVILPPTACIHGVDDSKKLSPEKRERLFTIIMREAVAVGIGYSSPEEIDRINILEATRSAMLTAVYNLSIPADFLLIDGISTIDCKIRQLTVKKGDSLSISIAAASIIAKVTRDRLMIEMDSRYPGYGFARHKGYGSSAHLESLRKLGPSPIHRLTFAGVKQPSA